MLNAALPGKPQMLVFICPETQGTYRGFAYDAVAIAYYNNVVLNALDNTAFGGAAHSYVIYPDGRVVLDSSADSDDPVYNLLAELREHSDLTGEKLDALSADLASGRNGSRMLTLHGTRYYLVYESTGIQDWTILSLVPVSIVNASMNRLWFRTIEIVVAVMVLLAVLIITLILRRSRAALRRKDTDILYRDELFNRLSHNVDDVFLMLDGETSHPDYISPNIERLLGLPLEQVRQDVHILATLHEAPPAATRTSSRDFSAASSANGTRIISISRPASAAGSISSPWALRRQAGPSTSSCCPTARPTVRSIRRFRTRSRPLSPPAAQRATS